VPQPDNGIVVKIAAQAGQQIQPGDTLIVLEAMKMKQHHRPRRRQDFEGQRQGRRPRAKRLVLVEFE